MTEKKPGRGGARPNSGGARPGAGRKPASPAGKREEHVISFPPETWMKLEPLANRSAFVAVAVEEKFSREMETATF